MPRLRIVLLVGLLCPCLGVVAARAQSTADATETPEASVRQLRLLLLPQRRVPPDLLRQLLPLLRDSGDVVLGIDYLRSARARGLDPTGPEAFEALLPEQRVDLVLVVSYERRAGRSLVRITYREGQHGFELLQEEHAIPGNQISEEVEWRIANEVRLAINTVAAAGGRRGQAGAQLPAIVLPMPNEAPHQKFASPPARKLALHVGLTAGFGMGTRSFLVPTPVSPVRLQTSLFPALSLRLHTDYEPRARGSLIWTVAVRYLTSLGLQTTDTRLDGSTAATGSRSHRFDIDGGLWRRLEAGAQVDVLVGVALGWGLRFFSSEAAVTLPNYFMTGPYLRPGVRFAFLGERLTAGVDPVFEWLAILDDTLTDAGVQPMGFALGGEAHLSYRVLTPFFLSLLYRESHAFLSAEQINPTDVERFIVLQATYRP